MCLEKRISLDPRLSAIADMLGTCFCCADIGSDHGRLGAFLLQNGYSRRVCFTDISAASLQKARKLISLLGLEDQASFCVGDGARALEEKVDGAVIAGMGGETIASILKNDQGLLDGAKLVLQPNVAIAQLRQCLCSCGWKIMDERLVRDGRRIYVLIAAQKGMQKLNAFECEVGPVLMARKPQLLKEYAQFRLRVIRKALEGARSGNDQASVQTLLDAEAIWQEVESWF